MVRSRRLGPTHAVVRRMRRVRAVVGPLVRRSPSLVRSRVVRMRRSVERLALVERRPAAMLHRLMTGHPPVVPMRRLTTYRALT